MLALVTSLLALVPGSVVVRDWLVIPPVDRAGRRPFAPNVVFERHLLAPDLAPPKVGEKLTGERGDEKAWAAQAVGEDGSLGGEIGWAYAEVPSAERRVVMAKLAGAGRLFVNGAGFLGDLYAYGFGGVPVELAQGENHVYVSGVRGTLRLELVDVDDPLVVGEWDHLVPDVVLGEPRQVGPLGFLVWNASLETREVVLRGGRGIDPSFTGSNAARARVPALSAWRFACPYDAAVMQRESGGSTMPELYLGKSEDARCHRVEVPLRSANEARRVGFTSQIDNSTQVFSLLPSRDRQHDVDQRVLLSLHGASVDSLSQARAYAQKSDVAVVCPMNRRPYGFDWQDWGRRDAYEALDAYCGVAPKPDRFYTRTACDMLRRSTRTVTRVPGDDTTSAVWHRASTLVLTGHSMGGHGTWHLAANDPDMFDGIAPSAGWASFDSYGGRPDGELKSLWLGADFASRTEDLAHNLVPLPTFVLHGTADDNVPDSEARALLKRLESLGGKPASHFQEGAGHWWDGELSAGADCVDHPSILALFGAARGSDAFTFDWTSADPGVDARHHWIEVLHPLVYGRPFRVIARRGESPQSVDLETENVRVLRVDPLTNGLALRIDGKSAGRRWPSGQSWELTADGWAILGREASGKTPACSGPFKRAFDRRFVLVYGTNGNADEDRELFERARHDQSVWLYRANATVPIVTDVEFLEQRFLDRNAILYGNRDTNACWSRVVGDDGPIDARRGELRLGEKTWKGDDLGAVFVRPRLDDARALVGVFADTGVRGTRLGYALAPFVSGVGYPDYAVFSSTILRSGDGGVLAAGWFDRDWKHDPRQYVRSE